MFSDELTGRRAAVVDAVSGRSLTYASLEGAVARLAGQLAAAGGGQRIALIAPNELVTLVAFLAIVRTGAAAAPINPALTEGETQRMITELEVDRVLCPSSVPPAPGADVVDDASFELAQSSDASPLPAVDRPDAVALLLQTSGTTGRPKAVPIRQRNLATSATTIGRTYELGPRDVAYGVMPLFHVHGLVGIGLSTLASGGTMVLGAPT
ncbi:MAG: AMP-binding protein, partial [Acidimicrobiaceae bacterium]|nr:AMP-binding protein [Acidimicrobiaceae bacterium]